MAKRVDRVAEQACGRAFLYNDPDSFRAGVREALRAIEAILGKPPRRPSQARPRKAPGA